MRRLPLLAASVAALALPALAQAPIATQVSLRASTAEASAGRYCEPFVCDPNQLSFASQDVLTFQFTGAPGSLYVLFYGGETKTCMRFPELAGGLMTDPAVPIFVESVGVLPDAPHRGLPCGAVIGSHRVYVGNVGPGLAAHAQVVALSANGGYDDMATLALSRPLRLST